MKKTFHGQVIVENIGLMLKLSFVLLKNCFCSSFNVLLCFVNLQPTLSFLQRASYGTNVFHVLVNAVLYDPIELTIG